MRKRSFAVLATLILLLNINGYAYGEQVSDQKPDYEKYGRIAISVIKEDFPGEEVKEYEYLGRKQITTTEVMDSFQFKVTKDGKTTLVTVQINHDLKNKKLLTLTVKEEIQQ